MFKVLSSIIAALAILVSVTACGSDSHDTNQIPVDPNGQWEQSYTDIPNTYITAKIADHHIRMMLSINDATDVYWVGTFDTDALHEGDVINSKKYNDEMDMSLLGSGGEDKNITFKNGELTFTFAIMGKVSHVRLSKVV